jgi:protein involved in polysaccharide export with SLBB domain
VNLDLNLNDQGQPVFLKALDKITVPQLVNYRDLGIVDISGQVLYPGLYAIQKKNETPLELINRAGGLTSEASLVNTQFFRLGTRVSVDLLKKNKNSFLLQNRDSIFIPKVLPYIEVIGGVNNPQLFEFKNTRFKFYINAAGGIASNVNLKKSYVSYPNGINNGVKNFLIFTKYPKVLKGSKIIVPDPIYAEKKKLSFSEMSALATIFTALVTLISVLK